LLKSLLQEFEGPVTDNNLGRLLSYNSAALFHGFDYSYRLFSGNLEYQT